MQNRSGLPASTIFLALVLLAFHYTGMRFYIYWSVSWYDLVVHCVGGVVVAFVTTLFAGYLFKKQWGLKPILSVTLLAAIVWEAYEYVFGISGALGHYWSDTLSDIVMGLIGAVIGVYIIRILFPVYNEQSA